MEPAAVYRRKWRALEDFLQRLRSRPEARQVARAFLFGSMLEGHPAPGSDVDLLVLGTGDLQALRQACAEAVLETSLETGERIEAVIFPLSDYYRPDAPLIRQIRQRGKEVLGMNADELRRAVLMGKHRLAANYLRVARYVYEHGDYRQAADLAYNAAETTVKALLLLETEELPRTHGGLVTRFGDLYVRTGKLPSDVGRDLHMALEVRARARYAEDTFISETDARTVLTLAERLLDELAHLETSLPEGE